MGRSYSSAMTGSLPPPRVALVVTVLNEAATIHEVLSSIEAQTRQPDEFAIVDSGSTDGTFAILAEWAGDSPSIQTLQVPGANISQGRNHAIGHTRAEIVAV